MGMGELELPLPLSEPPPARVSAVVLRVIAVVQLGRKYRSLGSSTALPVVVKNYCRDGSGSTVHLGCNYACTEQTTPAVVPCLATVVPYPQENASFTKERKTVFANQPSRHRTHQEASTNDDTRRRKRQQIPKH